MFGLLGLLRRIFFREEPGWQRAETHAARFLSRKGYQIIARNWRVKGGEIDVIATKGNLLVFVEVRYRAPGAKVGAAESVTAQKRARIIRAAKAFIAQNPDASKYNIRFDVVAIDGKRIQHIPAAFTT